MSDALDLERRAAEAAEGLPALLADAESLAATLMAGAHGRRRSGTGETFWQYRDYTRDDPASAIDWRQSARAPNRYFIRETEWETAATVRIWCGAAPSLDYASGAFPTKRRRVHVLAVALSLLLTRAGERVGMLPAEGPGQGGQRAVISIAERLCLGVAGRVEDTLPPLPHTGTTQSVYISDFYVGTDALAQRLREIAGTGVPSHFVQVSDPAEETFPFAGNHIFAPPAEAGRSLRFGDAAAVAEAYRTTRTAHLNTIEQVCQRLGATVIRHRTDTPATPALTALHHAISGRIS